MGTVTGWRFPLRPAIHVVMSTAAVACAVGGAAIALVLFAQHDVELTSSWRGTSASLFGLGIGGVAIAMVLAFAAITAARWAAPLAMATGLSVMALTTAGAMVGARDSDLGRRTLSAPAPERGIGGWGHVAAALIIAACVAGVVWSATRTRAESPALARLLFATSVGGSIAAVVLSGYSWATATPAHMVGETTGFLARGPLQAFILCVIVAVIIGLVWLLVARRHEFTAVCSGVILLAVVPLTIVGLVLAAPAVWTSIEIASGPAASPTMPWAIVGSCIAVVALVTAGTGLYVFSQTEQILLSRGVVALGVAGMVLMSSVLASGVAESQPTTDVTIVAGTRPSAVAAPTPDNPSRVAYRQQFGPSPAPPVVAVGDGYVTLDRNDLAFHDGATGRQRWSRPRSDLDSTPAFDDTERRQSTTLFATESPAGPTVTVVNRHGAVITLDALTGQVLWWTADDLDVLVSSGVTYSGSLVAVRRNSIRTEDRRRESKVARTLVALDLRTGAQRWSTTLPYGECAIDGDVIGETALVSDGCRSRGAPFYVDTNTGAITESRFETTTVAIAAISTRGEGFRVATSDRSNSMDRIVNYIFSPTPDSGGPVRTQVGAFLSDIRDGLAVTRTDGGQGTSLTDVRTGRALRSLDDVGDDSEWHWVGSTVMGVYRPSNPGMRSVFARIGADGSFTQVDTPCAGQTIEPASVTAVSGAVLVACDGVSDYGSTAQLVGLR